MTTKEEVLGVIKKLPESATYEDIMEELYFRQKVEKGLLDIEKGNLISHEEAKKRLSKWLTK